MHPEPASPALELASIDRQLIELCQRRCEILAQWHASQPSQSSLPPNSQFPTLREAQLESTRIVRDQPNQSNPAWSETLLHFVTGLSYQSAIHAEPIVYLGPQHSYSYQAAAKFFGSHNSLEPVSSIGAVFEEILRKQATYGVVPIENSTDGRIVDTLNMFIRNPIQICGEVLLPIHHNLLGLSQRHEITEVYSKPQALSQCRGWLSEHLPQARWVEVASTTAAAKIASEKPFAAAVASKEAAIHLGLNVIAESIEDNPNNVTRFAIIGHEQPNPTGRDKTSLLFQVPHKPGALADAMNLLRNNGLNLTWIESFPVPGANNEYFFFVELEGHRAQPNVERALTELGEMAFRLDFLGSYPKASLPLE